MSRRAASSTSKGGKDMPAGVLSNTSTDGPTTVTVAGMSATTSDTQSGIQPIATEGRVKLVRLRPTATTQSAAVLPGTVQNVEASRTGRADASSASTSVAEVIPSRNTTRITLPFGEVDVTSNATSTTGRRITAPEARAAALEARLQGEAASADSNHQPRGVTSEFDEAIPPRVASSTPRHTTNAKEASSAKRPLPQLDASRNPTSAASASSIPTAFGLLESGTSSGTSGISGTAGTSVAGGEPSGTTGTSHTGVTQQGTGGTLRTPAQKWQQDEGLAPIFLKPRLSGSPKKQPDVALDTGSPTPVKTKAVKVRHGDKNVKVKSTLKSPPRQ